MPAPIAQLGYMPNLNAPTVAGQPRQNPWMALAQNVLAAAAEGAVKNELSADVTDQAKAQGLGPQDAEKAGFWSKMVNGPTTSREQLDRYQTEAGATTRNAADIGARLSEGKANRALTQQDLDIRKAAQAADVSNADRTFKQKDTQFGVASGQEQQKIDLARTAQAQKARQDEVDNYMKSQVPPGTDATNASHLVGTVYDSMVMQWANTKLLHPGTEGPKPTVKDAHDAVMQAGENFKGSSIPGIQGPPFSMVPSYSGGGAGPL